MKTKRGILGLFLALCVVWSMLPLGAFAAENIAEDGEGTAESPYQISSTKELEYYRDLMNEGVDEYRSAHYALTADIDLNPGCTYNPETNQWSGSPLTWTPIGTENAPFTGTFDGQGHSITGLYIDSDSTYQGLFGYMSGTNSAVRNLTVSGTIRGNGSVGGVVGWNNGGTIENCHNTVAVSGSGSAGGVVGVSRGGTVTNCYNTGEVSDGFSAGGVVGYINAGGTVKNCYNTGAVNGSSYVGGVVGYNGGTVTNCCYLTDTADEGIGGSGNDGEDPTQPLSAEDFANQASFEDWNFDSTWEMSALLGRPILQSNREGGSGTPASPYEIPDLATLERARNLMNADTENTYRSASYVLTKDIDMSKEYGEGEDKGSWEPIGASFRSFTGTFDG